MPLQIGSTAGSSGVVKRGVVVPKGSLDVWRAARDAAATTRTEVVIFGDSTTYGSGANYSWVQKIRALSIAAGYPDGGRGIAAVDDTAQLSGPENISIVQSSTGSWGAGSTATDIMLTSTAASTVNGATIVFQGYGTAARLHYTKLGNGGTFTYSIDGGATTTVDTHIASGFTAGTVSLNLGGADTTLHTVTIVNTGTTTTDTRVTCEFLKTAGIVYHKHGVSGISMGGYFSIQNPDLGNYPAQVALGLTPGTTGAPIAVGWASTRAAKPAARNPSLAICALGVNDQQGATDIPSLTANLEQSTEVFIRMARAAGADPLIVIPHLDWSSQAHTYSGPAKRAINAVAMAHQCAIVDFNEALAPYNVNFSTYSGSGPHLNAAAHDAEATFLWTNALAL